MLDFLRRSATSAFAWLILGALALAFGLSFGLPSDSLTFGSEKYVKVYGEGIGDEEFRYQLQLASRYGLVPREVETQQSYGAREEMLEGIIERLLLAHTAEELGLGVTEKQAEDLVLNGHVILFGFTLEFLAKEDDFNYDMFKRNWLRPLGIAEKRYLEYQEQEYLARTLRDVIRVSAAVPESELRAAYDATANQISLRYARYEAMRFGETVDPTDAEVDAYVAANPESLAAAFATQGSRFAKLGKQMRVYAIEIPKPEGDDDGQATDAKAAEAAALAARLRIDGGEDFRAVAREVSRHPSARRGGDLHWVGETVGTGLDPVVDDAARTAEIDTVSEVLEGASSFYVIQVTGRREGDVPEADALRELAVEAIRKEEGSKLAKAAAQADSQAVLEGGKALTQVFSAPDALQADLATALGTPLEDVPIEGASDEDPTAIDKVAIRETGLTPKGQPLSGLGGPAPELVQAAWADTSGADLLPGVFAVGDDWVVAGVASKVEGTDEEYKQQRADLYDRAARQAGDAVSTRFAERLCLEARGKGDLVVSDAKVKRLMTYDTPPGDDKDAEQPTQTYQVCQRVGTRGGVLTAQWKFAEWR